VQKLLFLGSSCIYPKFAPQPIRAASFFIVMIWPKPCASYSRSTIRPKSSISAGARI
jgi:hypothetical protein